MNYYEVRISGRAYHSKKPLTYSHETSIEPGTIVSVPVRNKILKGYVLKSVKKPAFAVKNIDRIDNNPPLPKQSLALLEWMEEYYPSQSGTSLQLFMPSSITKKPSFGSDISEAVNSSVQKIPPLRSPQKAVLKAIEENQEKTFLLHGETGSGKTRVYAELAKEALNKKSSALILTPEIGLTTQLARNLEALTGAQPIVIHSQLTPKLKRERWKEIAHAKEGVLVVATRSGLFAPFQSLSLIVVDEAHEDAYKQEQAPRYHAVKVSAQLAKLHSAQLMLGSATPSVVDYAVFQSKKLPILEMANPGNEEDLSYELVDLKDRSQFASSPHLSSKLITRIKTAIENNEQALVFLNRRGTARLVLCQSCGWEDLCKSCDIARTFHADEHLMRCHTCGLTSPPPASCPECNGADIFYKQIGTKALISHVEKLFPDANVGRFDTDLSKEDRLEARYEDVRSGKINILVGTQLLSKGLDLPKLSVIGVVQADSSLLIPDFSAREKTYQQIHQIIGRVARGHRKGHVVIQTYNPESPLLISAAGKDFKSFLQSELSERKEFMYPPFCYMLKITCSRKLPAAAEQASIDVVNSIKSLPVQAQIIGPTPAFKSKSKGSYHWQIVVKSKQRGQILQIIESLPKNAGYDIDPVNLL